MSISSDVESYRPAEDQPKGLKEILESNSTDVRDLTINTIDASELLKINTLAESDFDTRVQDNFAYIKNLYAGDEKIDETERQELEDKFKIYLDNNGKLAKYFNGKDPDGLGSALDASKQAEVKKIIDGTTFELAIFRGEVEAFFLKEKVISGGGGSGGNGGGSGSYPADKSRGAFDGEGRDIDNAVAKMETDQGNMGVQYTAYTYGKVDNFDEDEDNVDSDENVKALKWILKGRKEELDIVDRDYNRSAADKSATNILTRVLLRIGGRKAGKQELNTSEIISKLENVIARYNTGEKFVMAGKGWKKVAKKHELGLDGYKLGALYQLTRVNAKGYPYLKKVMDLLVQEFTREGTDVNVKINGVEQTRLKTFADIYNEHSDMPTSKHLDLVTKKQAAIRAIEGADQPTRTKIRKLLRIAKDVDIEYLMTLANDLPAEKSSPKEFYNFVDEKYRQERGKSMGKREKDFFDLYKENKLYEENENDKAHTALKRVAEALASGMSIQDLVNAGKFTVDSGELNEEGNEQQFLNRFSDLNFDRKVDFGDKGMVNGLQFQRIYTSTAEKMRYEGRGQKEVLSNILTFGRLVAEGSGNTKMTEKIEKLFVDEKGDPKEVTFAEINNLFNGDDNLPLLKFLQKAVMESPVPVANILEHGVDAYQDFYDNSLTLPKEWIEKISKYIDKQLTDHGYNPDKYLDPMTREGCIQSVAEFAMMHQSGLGVGGSINIGSLVDAGNKSLDYFLDGLSINFGLGMVAGSSSTPTLGLNLARNKTAKTGDNSNFYYGVSTGVSMAMGFIPVPYASVGAGEEWLVNRKQLERDLEASSAKRISIGGSVTLISYAVPAYSINLSYGQDKMEGIEAQYSKIKSQSTGIAVTCFQAITETGADGKMAFGDKAKCLAAIKEVFRAKFDKSDEDTLGKAAFNFYKGLLAFNASAEDLQNRSPKAGQIANMLGDFYALAWRNSAVTGLSGRHFDNVGIGLTFFGDVFPVPTISLQWAKYKNLYNEDSPESEKQARMAQATGIGAEKMSDDNEANGERELDYINRMIDSSFQRSKSAINQFDKSNPNQAPNLLMSDDGTIKIPTDLREKNFINVDIDPILKGHIKIITENDKGYLVIPAGIPICFFDNSTSTRSESVLILGDKKTDGKKLNGYGDLMLRSGVGIPSSGVDSRIGDPNSPISTFEKITKIADINNVITNLNSGKDYAKFPLLSAERSKETGKEKQTVFTLKSQVQGKPNYVISSTSSTTLALNTTGDKLTLIPETGKLTVNYDGKNETYIFAYEEDKKDKLTISYRIDDLTSDEKIEENRKTLDPIKFNGNNKLYEFKDVKILEAESIIKVNTPKIKNAEMVNAEKYKAFELFMLHLWEIEDNNNIDDTEINKAIIELKKVLPAKNDLITFIDTNKGNYEVISYVTDRLKQIFALEDKYEGKTIAYLRGRRKDGDNKGYHTCKSPSREGFPKSIIREQQLGTLLPKPEDVKFHANDATLEPNLVGYTAFYKDKKNPACSMTAPGETTVCKNFITELSGEALVEGKNRFINNLEKQTYERALILKAVQSKFPPAIDTSKITSDDLIKFLKGEELYIPIDSGSKKYRLKLNATYHFYLLGECANESIGMKINSIDIREYAPKITPGVITPGSISEGEIDYKYKEGSNVGFRINNNQTRNEDRRGKKSTAGIDIGLGLAKPEKPGVVVEEKPELLDGGVSNPRLEIDGGSLPHVEVDGYSIPGGGDGNSGINP